MIKEHNKSILGNNLQGGIPTHNHTGHDDPLNITMSFFFNLPNEASCKLYNRVC